MTKQIEKSTGSYGRWLVRVSETDIRYFWKKRDALAFIASYA